MSLLDWSLDADERDFISFCKALVPHYDAASHIRRQLVPAIIRAATRKNSRLIVVMPPRHSKSLHVSENLPAWYLGKYPERRVIAASHTQALANTFSRRVRAKFFSHKYHERFSARIAHDKGAVEAWDLAGTTGGYVAVGRGGSPTGLGADLMIIDDPIRSYAEANSATIRDALWEWYRETMRTRLEPGGSIIITATRWHQDDLIGRLLQDLTGEQWEVLHLPAINDQDKALWPERWPLSTLLQIKRGVGERAWNAQYQGRPAPQAGAVFKRHWWRYWEPQYAGLPPVIVFPEPTQRAEISPRELPSWWDRMAQSWDMTFGIAAPATQTAKKAGDRGSFVVGLVGAMKGPDLFILDIFRARTGFPETVEAVAAMSRKWPDATAKLIERAANGPAVIATMSGKVSGIIGVPPEGSKESRAQAATPFVEAGNVYLPHPQVADWTNAFIDELASFPVGEHDDQVDAFSQLARYLIKPTNLELPEAFEEYVSAQLGGLA